MSKSRAYSDPELLARLSRLPLRARGVVEGNLSGMHASPFHGFNVEFAAYREYTPGDDLKRVDWRVFARSDRFYIKEYEEETNLRAYLMVDASASMRYGPPGRAKFDLAAKVAVALANLLIEQRDPVGLVLCDKDERLLLTPAATRAQFMRLVETLEAAETVNDTDLGPVFEKLAEQTRRRGLIIVLSDFLTDLDKLREGLRRLKFRGHEILLLQVLDRDELELPFKELVRFVDLEGTEEILAEPWGFRNAYKQAMAAFQAELREIAGSLASDYLLLVTDQDPGALLSHYLHARARRY